MERERGTAQDRGSPCAKWHSRCRDAQKHVQTELGTAGTTAEPAHTTQGDHQSSSRVTAARVSGFMETSRLEPPPAAARTPSSRLWAAREESAWQPALGLELLVSPLSGGGCLPPSDCAAMCAPGLTARFHMQLSRGSTSTCGSPFCPNSSSEHIPGRPTTASGPLSAPISLFLRLGLL